MKRAASIVFIVLIVLAALAAGMILGGKCPPVPAPAKPPVEAPVPPVAAPQDLPPPVPPAAPPTAPAKPEEPASITTTSSSGVSDLVDKAL